MVKGTFHIIHLDMQNNSCCFLDGNECIGTEHDRYRPAVEFGEVSILDADSQPDDIAEKGSGSRNIAHDQVYLMTVSHLRAIKTIIRRLAVVGAQRGAPRR